MNMAVSPEFLDNLQKQVTHLQRSLEEMNDRNRQDRVIILIDRSNLEHTFRRVDNSGLKIDYIKLTRFLQGYRFLKQVRIYYSDYMDGDFVPESEMNEYKRRLDFYAFLRYQGYILRGVRRRDFGEMRVEKGLDAALIRDMERLCRDNRCDTIVLVAGDGDYCEIVESAQKDYAVKVEVAFFPAQSARELVSRAKFIDLLKVKDRLLRDPRENSVVIESTTPMGLGSDKH
jgi:uncharacterized LabA/DUF88 family protein